MSPVKPKAFYILHIWARQSSHYLGYSSVTQGFYITKSRDDAEQFLNIQDAIESYDEFCDTHKTSLIQPGYEIIGYHVNAEKP